MAIRHSAGKGTVPGQLDTRAPVQPPAGAARSKPPASAEARERRRIAEGLHDEVGQLLAAAKLHLAPLLDPARALGAREELNERAQTVRDLLEQAIRATRSLTFRLGSPQLESEGLEAALAALVERRSAGAGPRIHFRRRGEIRPLDPAVAAAAFRGAREVLHNALRHARARRIHVGIEWHGPGLRITVADDGAGFDPAILARCFGPDGGFGLMSTRERLGKLGGRLRVASAPGRGTRIVLEAPAADPRTLR